MRVVLFKIVDLEHEGIVASGSIKLGTPQTFGKLKGPRQDDLDSNKRYIMSGKHMFGGGDEDKPNHNASLRLSIYVNPAAKGSILGDCAGSTAPAPAYIFCMTKEPTCDDPSRQAIFRISDPDGLAQTLRSLDERLGDYEINPVSYVSSTVDAFDPTKIKNPFEKGQDYRNEAEVRIVFSPVGKYQPDGITIAHHELAKFLEKIDPKD